MRVLVLTPWYPANPDDTTGRYIREANSALENLGHQVVTLVCEPWRPALAAALHYDWRQRPVTQGAMDGTVVRVSYGALPRNLSLSLNALMFDRSVGAAVRRLLAKFKPDVIHGHTEITAPLLANLSYAAQLPAVVTLHGINTARRLQKKGHLQRIGRGLANVSRVILVGSPLRDAYAAFCHRTDHFRIIGNGFTPQKVAAPSQVLSHDLLRFVSVSNLHEGKGIDITLRALAALNSGGITNWSYTVVGSGREQAALAALSQQLGISDKIVFRGALPPGEAVYQELERADIFVLPSYREAFGIAYLEAMAAGLVTIGVEQQGPAAFITSGKTGFLVAPHDVLALKTAITAIAANRTAAAAIADAGRRYVLANCTWQSHARALETVYREALP